MGAVVRCALVVLAGCASRAEIAAPPGPAAPAAASSDPGVAIETARRAPVPAATDAAERVAFVRAGSVWLMQPDGNGAEQVTVRPLASPDERPALSPDGRHLAFASRVGGVYRIHLVDLTELIPRAITDGGDGGDGEPSFSPDGGTLYFMRGDPRDHRDLYRLDLGAAVAALSRRNQLVAPERLLEGDDDDPERAGAPIATPDGRELILSADRRAGHGTGLYRLDLTSRRLSRITAVAGPRVIDREPTVSPDGRRIVFASNRHAARDPADDFDLYAVAPDGSGLTRLTDDPGSAYDPSFSPDGARLFFVSTRDRGAAFEEEIYVMAAGGGLQERLGRDASPQNRAPTAGRIAR